MLAAVFGSHVWHCEAFLSQKGMDILLPCRGYIPSTASSFQSGRVFTGQGITG